MQNFKFSILAAQMRGLYAWLYISLNEKDGAVSWLFPESAMLPKFGAYIIIRRNNDIDRSSSTTRESDRESN